jgi:hypothetical protein
MKAAGAASLIDGEVRRSLVDSSQATVPFVGDGRKAAQRHPKCHGNQREIKFFLAAGVSGSAPVQLNKADCLL